MPLEQELEPEITESPTPEGAVTFSREELEEPDEQLQPGQQQAEPDVLDRRGRRSWIKETKAEKERLSQELAREREERQNERLAFERRLATLEGRTSQPAQQQGQQSEAEQEVAYWEQQMDTAVAAIQHAAPNTPQNVLDQHRNLYKQAQRQMYAAIARSQVPQQPLPSQGQASPEGMLLRTQFPALYANTPQGRRLNREARYEAENLAEKYNRPLDYAIAVEANQLVAQRHGIGQKAPAPSPSQRAKFASVPGRAGATGGGGGEITLDSNQRKTALAYCNTPGRAHLSEREKFKIFAREVLSGVD